ncbi:MULTISPECIES: CHAT domain-containing protein [Spirulina sp. CCY15215]|uniref:CHAT domain-containing protein n=1 Tax=Spirulina sp. CCY15215 TaxID=2767591 RepID=UPI001951EA86|nr:CHAT domain-containing protein [Spirulina major]
MQLEKTHLFPAITVTLCLSGLNAPFVSAQSIQSASDTGTKVTADGDRFDISGGTLSGNGANLFHSFEQFGLDSNQIANFLSHPGIQNILARVIGGNPSIIDGLIQVTGGNANLYLMNPAGIVFGSHASLNVPGDFFATTATGIGLDGGIFSAFGSNDYLTLNGTPSTFEFNLENPAPLVNAGNLTVTPGHNIGLIGGSVVNTGTLSAPGGNILISAIPGTNRIKLSQPGGLLSLEIEVPFTKDGQPLPINALDLPELLVGAEDRGVTTGLQVHPDGAIFLGSQAISPPEAGTAFVMGNLDVKDSQGTSQGQQGIYLLGDRIGLFDARIDASGVNGGGNIFMGGDYQGKGNLPTADRLFIDENTIIRADALGEGNGGRIIAWADEVTGFYGEISARGGNQSGDGGFVEVSGKEYLLFKGFADVSTTQGIDGTILLDPRDITITDGVNSPDNASIMAALLDNTISLADFDATTDISIDKAFLESLTGNINLAATRNIFLDTGVSLNFVNATSVTLIADADANNGGDIILKTGSSLIANNANLLLDAYTINRQNNASISAKNITFRANNSSTGTNASIAGTGTLTFQARDPGQAILVGNNPMGFDPGLVLELNELNSIQKGFQSIVFDGGYSGGDIYFLDGQVLQDSVTITGANNFIGPDRATTWNLTGVGSGSVEGVSFSNVSRITGGNSSDTFIFNSGVNFNRFIDGGNGVDRLDYSASGNPATIDIANGTATGTSGIANIESLTPPILLPPPILTPTVISTISTPTVISTPTPPETTPSDPVFSPATIAPTHNIETITQLSANLVESEGDSTDWGDRQDIISLLDQGDLNSAIALLDQYYSDNFLRHLGKEKESSSTSVEEMQDILGRMAAKTGKSTATLYIFARPDRLDLILVPPTDAPIRYSIDIPRQRLLAEIQTFQHKLAHPIYRRNTQYLAPSQQLYQWLIAPVKKDLQRFNIEGIAFVLDDGLRTLPMAALHDGKQFLVENYAISLLPSLHLIPDHYTDIRNDSAIAMGMSEFSQQADLPAVPLEVATIAGQFPSQQTFLNETFTFDNLQHQPGRSGAKIVHLATHGQFQPGTPNESYIQLWDRQLSLEAMANLDWGNKIELLVLSACRTALGDETAEYGFAGLSVQTGVSSALASLWYASDTGTLALMSEFYHQLRSRRTKAEALQQAQIAMIAGNVRLEKAAENKSNSQLVGTLGRVNLPSELANLGDRAFQHPYYWSGFTLIGSPW